MINWRLVSLSEFTPITSNMELTHLGSESLLITIQETGGIA